MRASHLDRLLGEARAAVASGGDPDWKSLRARIRKEAPDEPTRRDTLARLERIGAVHRARRARSLADAPEPAARRPRAALRTRPTITGNMDVRRERAGESYVLAWSGEAAVERWELRISARSDGRGDYEPVETRELPGDTTSVELPLGEVPLRVHLLGRTRAGRLHRRAIVSGLQRESWDERLQRRPS